MKNVASFDSPLQRNPMASRFIFFVAINNHWGDAEIHIDVILSMGNYSAVVGNVYVVIAAVNEWVGI